MDTEILRREITLTADANFVYYKTVPLVNNGFYKKLMTKGYLLFDTEDGFAYILLETPNCYGSVDMHTYGEWATIEEAELWLANPTPLY